MLRVQCHSGVRVNERPVAFCLADHRLCVEEIVDRWYGERASYFKVRANDQNIYLLKYDGYRDGWDLVLYQNPEKLNRMASNPEVVPPVRKSLSADRDPRHPLKLN